VSVSQVYFGSTQAAVQVANGSPIGVVKSHCQVDSLHVYFGSTQAAVQVAKLYSPASSR